VATLSTYFHNSRPEMRGLLPQLPSYGRTLEIGCAAGLFSSALHAQERWGIEPRKEYAKEAEARGLRVLNGLYEDQERYLPDSYFDLVIANDVIEHMQDHESFLRAIRHKIAPTGFLVLSVPNIRSLATLLRLILGKDWKYTDDGVLDRTHLRFFTEKSLHRSLSDSGYLVESLQGLRSIFRFDAGIPIRKAVLNWMLGAAVIGISLGHARDTRFLQYGIRARPLP
jgi:2-polyprenyl-3-methyl-5-hydroxy-6-metoxy-1,4-benzoquinol methylase